MEQKPRRPVLTPPPAKANPNLSPRGPRPVLQDGRSSRSKLVFILALSIVVIAAIGVVVILPKLISQPSGTPMANSEAPKTDRPAGTPSKKDPLSFQANAKVKAESLLREVLRYQARLETDGVKVWGKGKLTTSYGDALAQVAVANSHLDTGRFDLAAKKYAETLSLFEQLDKSRPVRLRNALRDGTEALKRFDDEAARTQFAIVLSLDPGNADATRGLQRAKNLKRVSDRIRQGRAFESRGDLDQAKNAYREAIALDGDNPSARDRLRRIDELILARNYESAISAASAALGRKDYAESKSFLDRAARIRPNALEVRDISRKLQEAIQVDALERIRRIASQHEKNERWKQALESYDQALQIDKNATFALRGRTRAEKFFKLHEQVDYYLANPERLQSPDPLAHSRKLVVASNALPDPGADLREKIDRLKILIDRYSTPRPVVLRSDEKTRVTVYQVGRFSPFSERRVTLLPGEYTAVGSREGYRDVRVKFRVPSTGEETTVIIRCEERI